MNQKITVVFISAVLASVAAFDFMETDFQDSLDRIIA